MDKTFAEFLETAVASNPNLKPLEAVPLFRNEFPEAADTTDEQIRNKVAALKTAANKWARSDDQQ